MPSEHSEDSAQSAYPYKLIVGGGGVLQNDTSWFVGPKFERRSLYQNVHLRSLIFWYESCLFATATEDLFLLHDRNTTSKKTQN